MSVGSIRPLEVPNFEMAGTGTRLPATINQLNDPKLATDGKLRDAFDTFVGETFYGNLTSAMRKTVEKPAYFHGGRAEEAFQGQLDQLLVSRMADASADQFTGPMFELFNLNRR